MYLLKPLDPTQFYQVKIKSMGKPTWVTTQLNICLLIFIGNDKIVRYHNIPTISRPNTLKTHLKKEICFLILFIIFMC